MYQKRTMGFFMMLLVIGGNSFSQSRLRERVLFEDNNLVIFEMFSEVSYSGKWINSSYLAFENKTNYEMEVKFNATIRIVALTSSGKERTEKFMNETIRIGSRGRYLLIPATGTGKISNIYPRFMDETYFSTLDELIHYRVNRTSHEIPW